MNGALSGRNGATRTMLVLATASLIAGGALAGCGTSGPSARASKRTSTSRWKKAIEEGKESAEKGIEEGKAEAKKAEEEAKKQIEEAT